MTHISLFSHKSRRGISSVVGALIFTVLMIAGFSAMSLALDSQTDIVNTQRVVADVELKKQQEKFDISVSTDANNILDVSVDNTGQNPVEISRIWITNKTLPTQPAKPFSVNSNDAFVPSGFKSNILATQPLYITPDTYDVKIISTLGTVKIAELSYGSSSNGLRAELITDPPDVIVGQNVTVAMLVTNTGSETIYNVRPNPLTFVGTGTGHIVSSSANIPTFTDLNGGASVMFSWDYQVDGDSGNQLRFSGSAVGDGGHTSNPVSDISVLRLPTDGSSGSTDPDIVNDELLARPQLFIIIPSSQGKSDDAQAVWGINVVNPINADMQVSKLVITAFAPGAQNNDKLFDRGGGACTFNPISPVLGSDSNWSCPSENALMWQSTTPIIIPGNSTKSFLTKVEPGKPSGTASLESVVVQGSVFTTLGSFGKAGYQSTMSGTDSSIINVHLTSDPLNPRSSNNIMSSIVGISPNSIRLFNVTLADMDTVSSTTINSGAKLIINVPKDWTDVTITNSVGFVGTPSVTKFGDNSHQIVGVTSTALGSASNVADIISFTARAPNITTDKLYVMYVLAQGQTNSGFSIGPLAEVVLQVDTP
ncbi:MAG: hypothetical protein KGZ34_07755 [Nitrosarchaeum sp.]|nr:hypothetical protein [Nitrosarchaeum sp.]